MVKRIVTRPNSFTRRTKLNSNNPHYQLWGGGISAINSIHSIYRGKNNRSERYRTYDWMDLDSDISRALDLIAQHCTDKNIEGRRWSFDFKVDDVTEEMTEVLKAHCDHWSKINKMETSMYKVTRNTLKYGDWFAFRNPYTYELYDIKPSDVQGALIEERTQKIVGWFVKKFRWNVTDMEIDVPRNDANVVNVQLDNSSIMGVNGEERTGEFIPSAHILHFSLSEGKLATAGLLEQDAQATGGQETNIWPFGISWLEKVFKTYKQRELLEDAILIHRTQRAPTRNVWYIDTGRVRPDKSTQMVNHFKDEMNLKRIPKVFGQNQVGMDSAYHPFAQMEDYYIPVTQDQRGSKVEQLEGQQWNQIPELDYIKTKMAKALRVPTNWIFDITNNVTAGTVNVNAGGITQEEIEFSKFCDRIQTFLIETWDEEFKTYLQFRDVNINESDFSLKFNPPTDYQASKDRAKLTEAANAMAPFLNYPFFSKRNIMMKVLGWTEDQVAENERMLLEERNGETAPSESGDLYGLGGGGIPLSTEPLVGPEGGLPLSQENPYGDGQLGGGQFGGAGAGGGFGGALGGGGFGEMKSSMEGDRNFLIEDLSMDLPKPKQDTSDNDEGFEGLNDRSFSGDPIKRKKFEVPLKILQKMRKNEFAKQVRYVHRKKMMSDVYAPIAPPDALGGGGALL